MVRPQVSRMIQGSPNPLRTSERLLISYAVRTGLDILSAQYTPSPRTPASIRTWDSYGAGGWYEIRVQPNFLDWLQMIIQPTRQRRVFIFFIARLWEHLQCEETVRRAFSGQTTWDAGNLGVFREALRANSRFGVADTHLRPSGAWTIHSQRTSPDYSVLVNPLEKSSYKALRYFLKSDWVIAQTSK